ncbi:uncharacterized protein EI97DRAFT_299651 [Westerdykella ornata]|uniref:Uncharacterized protein n=1 Tax=Westerdykella ornata TaxID=318751 RepID=A0A6A6JLT8_WESOR|nr:uncharacterized protein EI97DRAFT_299651 [Westerdykella ornata]KAF2277630.1 hypothetical protein EI97DRAFT_299651 [Westerdykella ornata]
MSSNEREGRSCDDGIACMEVRRALRRRPLSGSPMRHQPQRAVEEPSQDSPQPRPPCDDNDSNNIITWQPSHTHARSVSWFVSSVARPGRTMQPKAARRVTHGSPWMLRLHLRPAFSIADGCSKVATSDTPRLFDRSTRKARVPRRHSYRLEQLPCTLAAVDLSACAGPQH